MTFAFTHERHAHLRLRSLQSGNPPTVIVINGFLSQHEHLPETHWQPLLHKFFGTHAWSFLDWEAKSTLDLYHRLNNPTYQPSLQSALAAWMAGGGQMGPHLKPIFTQYARESGLDQLWTHAQSNAHEAGIYLAECIQSTAADKKFILIGYSLGALVIVATLQKLVEYQERKIAHIHLLGGAVSIQYPWTQLATVVSGTIHNYYSRNDQVLGFAYNQLVNGGQSVGSCAIRAGHTKIVDHDVSALVGNHGMFKPKAIDFLTVP